MFAAAPVGMVRFERDGTMSAVNAGLAQIVGQEIEDLTGKNAASFIHPDDLDRQVRVLTGLFRGRYDQSHGEVRLVHREGSTVFTKYGAAVMRDEQGVARHVITVVEDVTERNKMEIELRHAQKLESVWRLAAGIAHEINTPIQFVGDNLTFLETAVADLLGLVDGYQHMVAQARQRPLADSEMQLLAQAEEAADLTYVRQNVGRSFAATLDGVRRVATIVQSIKNFAHPDRGEKTPANINSALQSALSVATNELKYVARVETELGDLPLLPCYLGDLNQVLLNLLINAAHAIRTVVGDSGAKGTIRVRTALEAGQVVISISDTGCGIAPEIRDKIFDPFFTTKEVGEGTGQGLALARSVVVDKHGGSITFTTQVGQGTTFVVRLPLPVQTPAPATAT